MKKLIDIIEGLEILKSIGILDHISVDSIVFDSRKVVPGALFVATRGTQVDGHEYIDTSIEMGAKVIMCERIPEVRLEGVNYIEVRNSQYALGIIASNFYDRPSENLQVIGITGTNGKTSCASMLFN